MLSNRIAKARGILILLGSLSLAACSDSSTAPQRSIDRVAAARVMPSVTDARVRLAVGIDNPSVRERVVHDLRELELALTNGDGEKARFHSGVLATVLKDYRSQQGSLTTDGADVSGIVLTLHAVSEAIEVRLDLW
jgi:hypothetical protein